MAGMVGLSITLLLCVLHTINAETSVCSNYEFVSVTSQQYLSGQTSTQTFKLQTASTGIPTLTVTDSATSTTSQQESCAIIKKNTQDAEVIMSFRVLGTGSFRYCWKGILRNSVLFYVKGPSVSTSTGYTTAQCLAQLSSTTSYQMMMKMPLPSTSLTRPSFGVDMSSVVKPGTYKLSYAFDNQAQVCEGSSVSESSVVVTSDSVMWKPCGAYTTSYKTPFNKELIIAGYVEDTSLDVIRDASQVAGAFFVLVYHEPGQDFKYYLMRVFQSASTDVSQGSYLEMFGLTTNDDPYSPTGYVDLRYVPSSNADNVLKIRAFSDSCQSNPCRNGGTCVNKWLNYKCLCPIGFTGDTCEIMDDECSKTANSRSLCSDHGTCVPTASSYTCDCDDGFVGPQCQDATTCRTDTCKNGGTCYDPHVDSMAICKCTTGFSGPTCTDTTTCHDTKPCKNGGTCYDGDNGSYICICPPDYTGTNCDGADTRPSAPLICVEGIPDICHNGGICIDGKCVCQAYYTGRYCEDINDWFIGSVVLIVLLAVIMVVTLIVCCFFCARGDTSLSGTGTGEKSYNQYMTGGRDAAASSTYGYVADGFTANRYPDPSFYNDGYSGRL